MFAIFLPFLSIIGFAAFFSRCLALPLAPLLFASTAGIGILQFLFAMTNCLALGSLLVLISGIVLFVYSLVKLDLRFFYTRLFKSTKSRGFDRGNHDAQTSVYVHGPRGRSRGDSTLLKVKYKKLEDRVKRKENHTTAGIYLLFAYFIFLFDWGLRFSSIDDYSFWGVMSHYLFYFNKLPTNADIISASYLTYTPGMACFHYLFYYATGQYSQFAGFVGQGAILLSALMVLFDPKNVRASMFQIAIAYIILNVGFGTLLARMEVDGYVAAYVFASAWLIFKNTRHGGLLVFFPILFLSLIKEIGLFFGVMLCIAFLITHTKSKKNLGLVALLLAGLFGLKSIWLLHCHHYGFTSFSKAIHLPNALAALNPFNTYFQPAQHLVIKTLLLGRFGHVLEWPNSVTYLLLFYMWHKLSIHMKIKNRQSAIQLRWLFVTVLIIYAIMLYLLQAITFDVGHTFDHTLDFQRYYNMLLIPFFLFTVLVYAEENVPQQQSTWQKHLPITVMFIALIFAISGKIERTIRNKRPNVIYKLIEMVHQQLPENESWTLCLDNPPQPTYQTSIPMAYFLLPNKVTLVDGAEGCNYRMVWSKGTTLPKILRIVPSNT